MTTRPSNRRSDVVVRPLVERDLDQADLVFRTAFGTFMGAPEPEKFFGDVDFVRTRWRADPAAAFAAELNGELVGSNLVTNWGSVGFFGPLTVRPDCWDRGIAKRMLEPTMELFASWKTRQVGLLTFAESPKHVGLYQSFGFWPRYLIAAMAMPVVAPVGAPPGPPEVAPGRAGAPGRAVAYTRFSEVASHDRAGLTSSVRELTSAVFEGLDVTREIDAVLDQKLGETVLISDASGLQAVAVCHIGPGTEAGSDTCYVKFGAARPGRKAARSFGQLIDACQDLAATSGVSVLSAGVNFGRERAYAALRQRGFRVQFQGIAMHRGNEPGYDKPNCYVIDDWR
jgi:GNAT superfamily N-acetyltransferase